MSTPSQRGFFDLTRRYEALSQKGDPLAPLAQVVPWETFRPTLAKAFVAPNGRRGGDLTSRPVCMFKGRVAPSARRARRVGVFGVSLPGEGSVP
jgi:hypothetical protein